MYSEGANGERSADSNGEEDVRGGSEGDVESDCKKEDESPNEAERRPGLRPIFMIVQDTDGVEVMMEGSDIISGDEMRDEYRYSAVVVIRSIEMSQYISVKVGTLFDISRDNRGRRY